MLFKHILIASILTLAAPACDSGEAPVAAPVPREAPDVPWPSVSIEGEIESPINVGKILHGCFDGDLKYGAPTLVDYFDEAPDGDDQQAAQLCVSWSAHLDVADCVRIGLISAGGVPTPQEP